MRVRLSVVTDLAGVIISVPAPAAVDVPAGAFVPDQQTTVEVTARVPLRQRGPPVNDIFQLRDIVGKIVEHELFP